MSDDLAAFRLRIDQNPAKRLVPKHVKPNAFDLARAIAETRATIAHLSRHDLDAAVECPTRRAYNGQPCVDQCRCGGVGYVLAGELVKRYLGTLKWLEGKS